MRKVFDKYNLISGLHTFCSDENKIFLNILKTLRLLNEMEKRDLLNNLKNLNFNPQSKKAA